MQLQSTLNNLSNSSPIIGYRFESRPMGGPDNSRPIGNWGELLTTWPPEDLQSSQVRNVEKLVPARGENTVVAYFHRHEVAGEVEAKITEFNPERLDYPVYEVVELTLLKNSDFTDQNTT